MQRNGLACAILTLGALLAGCGGGGGSKAVTESPANETTDPNDSIDEGSGNNSETDNTPPEVTSFDPVNGSVGVEPDARPSVTFKEEILVSSVNNNTVKLLDASSEPISGAFGLSQDSKTITFTPEIPLSLGETYTFSISTGVTDLSGNPLAAGQNSEFTTDFGSWGGTPFTLIDEPVYPDDVNTAISPNGDFWAIYTPKDRSSTDTIQWSEGNQFTYTLETEVPTFRGSGNVVITNALTALWPIDPNQFPNIESSTFNQDTSSWPPGRTAQLSTGRTLSVKAKSGPLGETYAVSVSEYGSPETKQITAAIRDPQTGGWTFERLNISEEFSDYDIAVGSDGDATVVWGASSPEAGAYAAFYDNSLGQWSPALELSDASPSRIDSIAVTTTEEGSVFVAWSQRQSASGPRVYESSHSGDGQWEQPSLLRESTDSRSIIGDIEIASGKGEVIVGWRERSGDSTEIASRTWRKGSGWDSKETIFAEVATYSDMNLMAISYLPDGSATAILNGSTNILSNIERRVFTVQQTANGWASARIIDSPQGTDANFVDLVSGDNGKKLLSWVVQQDSFNPTKAEALLYD